MRPFFTATLLCGLCGSFASSQWQPQAIQTDADFRGLSAVNSNVAWVSGTKGTFGRTTDGGKPDDTVATGAITTDGGKSWKLIEKPLPFRSGVAWAKDRWVAVGRSGYEVSVDDGATWKRLDKEKYNGVAFTSAGDGWAAGPNGRIAKFVMADK